MSTIIGLICGFLLIVWRRNIEADKETKDESETKQVEGLTTSRVFYALFYLLVVIFTVVMWFA